MSTPETIISSNATFRLDVPYRIVETGEKGKKKPLIVYLHGFRQNKEIIERKMKDLWQIEAYHLYIDAPYVLYDTTRKMEVSRWGRSWYLYDGKQEQFISSLELSSEFLQELLDHCFEIMNISKLALVGYSMGGYLGGYFALSRWKYVNEAIIIGARIKTEVFEDRLDQASHVGFLALHGEKDESVLPEPQRKEIEKLKSKGFNARFEMLECGHELNELVVQKAIKWLKELDY